MVNRQGREGMEVKRGRGAIRVIDRVGEVRCRDGMINGQGTRVE